MPSRRRSRIKSISGNINDVQKRLRYLETRPAPAQLAKKVVGTQNIALRAIQPDVVADAAIIRRTLAPEAVISTNLAVVGDPDDAAVATENIQLLAVDTDQIADDAVKTAKINDLAVVTDKIDDLAVVTDKIDDLAVVTDKIDDLAVTTAKIDDLSVITDKIDDLAVTTDKIDDLAVTTAKIAELAVTTTEIDDLAVTTAKIEDLAITTGKIEDLAVTDDKIDGISGDKIIGGVDGELIVAQTIAGSDTLGAALSKFYPNSIGEEDIATDAIGFDELQADSVGSAQIRFNAVVESVIDNLAIARRHMQDDVIIARMINAGAVQTEKIQNLAVTGAKIANGTVTNAKIDTVSYEKIVGPGNLVQNGITLANSSGLNGSLLGGSQPAAGRFSISVQFGLGNLDVARGDHVHSGGGTVPSHTHSFSDESSTNSGASHTHFVSGTTGTPSTLKLKKEITDYSMVDVKNLLNLNLKRYKYKNQARNLQEGREWMYGYIAEEVEELGIQEIIGYDENKEPNAINYSLLSTLVLELVKVQQTEIDSLKEEIQRLKEKI